MRAYNLFRTSAGGELSCAVPEDCAVPLFLSEGGWRFERKLDDGDALPTYFDRRAAAAGAHFNGFYLFEAFRPL